MINTFFLNSEYYKKLFCICFLFIKKHIQKPKFFRIYEKTLEIKRYSISKKDRTISGINHAYKYVLGLYWESAKVALRRIPKEVAKVLSLHIFSANDD